MQEDEHRLPLGGSLGKSRGLDRFEVGRLAAGADPAVQAGFLLQARFDRPHQRARSGPAHAQARHLLDRAAELFLRRIDDCIAGLADQHRMNLAHQPADQRRRRVADEAARCGTLGAQLLEQHLAVGADQVGPALQQRRAQLLGAGDEGRAVGELEHQHLVVAGRLVQRLRRAVADAARRRADIEARARPQKAARQERIVGLADRAGRCAQQRRQGRFEPAPGQLDRGRVGHGGLSKVAIPGHCRRASLRSADRRFRRKFSAPSPARCRRSAGFAGTRPKAGSPG